MDEILSAEFSTRNRNYSVDIAIKGSDSFGIDLIDLDTSERWSSEFAASYIEELTRKSGMAKRISVFWRMLQTALDGSSNEVSFDVLTTEDVAALQKQSRSKRTPKRMNDDKRYFIVTQVTEFDKVHFPLALVKNPFTSEEYGEIIRNLRMENRQLKESDGSEKIAELEAKIYDLNATYTAMLEERDQIIQELEMQLQDYYNKPRYSGSQRNYSPSVGSRGSARSTSSKGSRVSTNSKGSRTSKGASQRRYNDDYVQPRKASPSGRNQSPNRTGRNQRIARIEEETDNKLRQLRNLVARRYN